MAPTEVIPAGWYPDPDDPQSARWWDGEGWSRHSRVLGGTNSAESASTSPAPWSARAAELDTDFSGVEPSPPDPTLPSFSRRLSGLHPEEWKEPREEARGERERRRPTPVLREAREPSAPREPRTTREPHPARDLRWLRAVAIIVGILVVGAVAFQLLGGKLLNGLGVPGAGDYGVGVVAAQANDAGQLPAGTGTMAERVASLLDEKLGVAHGSVDCTMSESLVQVGSTFPCTLLRGSGTDLTGSRLSVTIRQGERVSYTELAPG